MNAIQLLNVPVSTLNQVMPRETTGSKEYFRIFPLNLSGHPRTSFYPCILLLLSTALLHFELAQPPRYSISCSPSPTSCVSSYGQLKHTASPSLLPLLLLLPSSSSLLPAFLLWDRSKIPPRLLPVTEDHDRMYAVLKESGLDYVAVMPPHIAGEPGDRLECSYYHRPIQTLNVSTHFLK